MLPSWASFISRFVAYFVSASAGLIYMFRMYAGSASEFAAFGLITFATTATLSGLCYAKASILPDSERPIYVFCGEKFLHASLLGLQVLVLKFVEASVSILLSAHPTLKAVSSFLFYILFSFSKRMNG
jgi:hypothetical protein